jgi:adenylate cyclase
VRIGISLGDVIVDGDDLYGNGVNVASRMETLAQPSEVCISQNVHEHISKSMDAVFEDLGDQTVKGVDHPIRCYRLVPNSEKLGDAEATERQKPLPLPEKSSIAVLPFKNMSNDPEQEFFADGMAEDIITALARYRSLFVIARNGWHQITWTLGKATSVGFGTFIDLPRRIMQKPAGCFVNRHQRRSNSLNLFPA